MRFSVKAKLASTFGVVTILSLITGGVAYNKLNSAGRRRNKIWFSKANACAGPPN